MRRWKVALATGLTLFVAPYGFGERVPQPDDSQSLPYLAPEIELPEPLRVLAPQTDDGTFSAQPTNQKAMEGVQADATSAIFVVYLPTDANLYIEGTQVGLTGSVRRFTCPSALEEGQTYSYTFRAQWDSQGQTLNSVRTVYFIAGSTNEVRFAATSFTAPASPATRPARCWGPWGWTYSCGSSGTYNGKLPTRTSPSGNWGTTYNEQLHQQYGSHYDNYYRNGDSYDYSRKVPTPAPPPTIGKKVNW